MSATRFTPWRIWSVSLLRRRRAGKECAVTCWPSVACHWLWSRTNELNVHFSVGVYAEVPVFLSGSDYHTGWANRALLHRAGITAEFISHLPESERQYYG